MSSPLLFLAILIAGTTAMLVVQLLKQRIHHHRLVMLAREWRMHYAPDDRFGLAPRVAERLPIPGAADVRIVDLIYGSEHGTRRYVFSAQYTRGVVGWKRREQCVASLAETREVWSGLIVAPEGLPLVEQYRKVARSQEAGENERSREPGARSQ